MRALILAVALLAGCASPAPLVPREGSVTRPLPQAEEQCRAQPELDWCHAR